VGFKREEDAEKALKYFHNTYIFSSKISVELAASADQMRQKEQKNVDIRGFGILVVGGGFGISNVVIREFGILGGLWEGIMRKFIFS
jgi:hypothetical protein